MVQAEAEAAMAVENSIRPHDIEQEEEETMEERLDKCNREWARHYVKMMYSHSSSSHGAAKQNTTTIVTMDTKVNSENDTSSHVHVHADDVIHDDDDVIAIATASLGTSPTDVIHGADYLMLGLQHQHQVQHDFIPAPPRTLGGWVRPLDIGPKWSVSKNNYSDSDSNTCNCSDTGRDTVKRSSVRFGSVEVREYSVVIGSHPLCREGLALSLGWFYSEPRMYDNLQHYHNHIVRKHRQRRTNGHLFLYLQHKQQLEQQQHALDDADRTTTVLQTATFDNDDDDDDHEYTTLKRPARAFLLTYQERLELHQLMSNYRLSEPQLRQIDIEQRDDPQEPHNMHDQSVQTIAQDQPQQPCCSGSPLLQHRHRQRQTSSNHKIGGGIRRGRRYRSCGRLASKI
jgi:hypothetical protein